MSEIDGCQTRSDGGIYIGQKENVDVGLRWPIRLYILQFQHDYLIDFQNIKFVMDRIF